MDRAPQAMVRRRRVGVIRGTERRVWHSVGRCWSRRQPPFAAWCRV